MEYKTEVKHPWLFSIALVVFPYRMLWGETPRMFDFFFIFHLFVYLFSVNFYRTGAHFRSFIKNKIRMLPKILEYI